MAFTQEVPIQSHPVGTVTSASRVVPAGLSQITAKIDTSISGPQPTLPQDAITLHIQWSFDGGTTFPVSEDFDIGGPLRNGGTPPYLCKTDVPQSPYPTDARAGYTVTQAQTFGIAVQLS